MKMAKEEKSTYLSLMRCPAIPATEKQKSLFFKPQGIGDYGLSATCLPIVNTGLKGRFELGINLGLINFLAGAGRLI
jgi:hypothetical protein